MAKTVASAQTFVRSMTLVGSFLAKAAGIAGVAGMAVFAHALQTPVVLGMSGWTGFAPLTLADKAGIFKKNGLDVEIKMIPQKDRHLALAAGGVTALAVVAPTGWAQPSGDPPTESPSTVESNPAQFGLSGDEVSRRKRLVQEVGGEIEDMREELQKKITWAVEETVGFGQE